MKSQLSPKHWILLSSYLDDELNPREKARVEKLLKSQAVFREAMDGLRGTKMVLRQAPARRAPRNFTLPASMAKTKPSPSLRLVPALRLSSAVVAMVSVFLMVSTLLTGMPASLQMDSTITVEMAPQEPAMLEAAEAPAAEGEQQGPPVVYWGGPPLPKTANGIGGGAAEPGVDGLGGGSYETLPNAWGMGGGNEIVSTPDVMATTEVELYLPEPTPAPEMSLPQPTATPGLLMDRAPAAEESLYGTGPILGVAPTEQQGGILPETNRQMLPVISVSDADQERGGQSRPLPLLGVIGIGLFAIAIGLFITGIVIRRNALH